MLKICSSRKKPITMLYPNILHAVVVVIAATVVAAAIFVAQVPSAQQLEMLRNLDERSQQRPPNGNRR